MTSAVTSVRAVARNACSWALLLAPLLLVPAGRADAANEITVTPITWDVLGLDSNNPPVGPYHFPIGMRLCNTTATTATGVTATWNWTTANAYVDLRPGTYGIPVASGGLGPLAVGDLAPGACKDAYFEIEVQKTPAAYDTTRGYVVTASDSTAAKTGSSPTPRQLYVEHLISQARNSVLNMQYGTSPTSLVDVAAGGSMTLIVGQTYYIKLIGATATNGYEQLETFVSFPNTIFQVLSVQSTSAAVSTRVGSPYNTLYADACQWDPNPLSLTYRSCLDVGKNGGNITVLYEVKILQAPSAPLLNPEPLSTLIYDFSGSSYHYNADYGVQSRYAYVLDPATLSIAKSFVPDAVLPAGVSKLTIRIPNPTPNVLTGVNFVDPLPTNLTVASPPNASTSGCGLPTFAPAAGATSLSFSLGDIPANSTCTITVDVTPSTQGSFVNTTGHLFINGTTPGTGIDTGKTATATLTASASAITCTTGTMAQWTMPATMTNPPDTAGGNATTRAVNVSTATASALDTGRTGIVTNSGQNDTYSWQTYGWKTPYQRLDFVIQSKNYSSVSMTYYVRNAGAANGPDLLTVSESANGGASFTTEETTNASPSKLPDAWTLHTVSLPGASTTGNTIVRFIANNANNDSSGGALLFDNITFTGCSYYPPPQLSKAFDTNPIIVSTEVSRLRFTMTNPASGVGGYDAVNLADATFSDTLPAGLVIVNNASSPAATTCTSTSGAALALTAADGTTAISLAGAELGVGGSCTVDVYVKGTAAGNYQNVSGYVSSATSGANKSSSGYGTANITVVAPPVISKAFGATAVRTGDTTTLSFTITNPNVATVLAGVNFADALPAGVVVAATPNAQGSCVGGTSGTITAVAGSGTVSVSGASLSATGVCTYSVDVTASTSGTKDNSVTVGYSHPRTGLAATGNTATASLIVSDPRPAIAVRKEISTAATGPWSSFVAASVGAIVYYRIQVENTGDVALNPVTVSDPAVSLTGCPTALPLDDPATPAVNEAAATCGIVSSTAVAGYHTNTVTASGSYGSSTASDTSMASYSTTGLTLVKRALEESYTAVGALLHYEFGVTNTGAADLQGPLSVTDNVTSAPTGPVTVTCPAISTVGNLDGILNRGETVVCTATYTVPAGPPALIANTAVAGAFTIPVAPAPPVAVSSNTADASVPLLASMDIGVTKTDGRTALVRGGGTTYTITITNSGPSAGTATIKDPAASCLNKLSVGNCQATGGAACPAGLTIANLEGAGGVPITTLMPDGSSISFDVTAREDNTGGCVGVPDVTNTVTLSGQSVPDGNPGNDSASDTDTLTAPTAAVVSRFTARPDRGGVVVEWETLAEAATIGFDLLRWSEQDGGYHTVNPELLPAALDPDGGRYAYLDAGVRPGERPIYAVVEVEASGVRTAHGPYHVDRRFPTRGAGGAFDGPLTPGARGYARAPRRTPIERTPIERAPIERAPGGAARTAVRQAARNVSGRPSITVYGTEPLPPVRASALPPVQSPASGPPAEVAPAGARPSAGPPREAPAPSPSPVSPQPNESRTAVKVGVRDNGVYFVSTADLVRSGLELHSAKAPTALTSGGSRVAVLPAADGSGVYFYGEAIDSIYARDNVYRFETGTPRSPVVSSRRGSALPSSGAETFTRTVHAEENRLALTALYDDPESDYWVWSSVFAGWGSRTFSVRTDAPAGSGTATIHVRLRGGSETAAGADHHAVVRLDGQPIGDVVFDGLAIAEADLEVPASLLADGENTLEVEGMKEPGVPYSLFYVDSFDVRYQSLYRARGNRLTCNAGDNASFLISGFTRSEITVLDVSDRRRPVLVEAPVSSTPDGYGVLVAASSPTAVYHAFTPDSVFAPAWLEADTPSDLRNRKNEADYLIITTAALAPAAQKLADYRSDLRSMVVDVADVYDEFNYGVQSPHALRAFLEHARRQWQTPPRYVLLAGDGTYDYRNALGKNDSLLPAMMVRTPGGLYPSDGWLLGEDAGAEPVTVIGRLPVGSAEELEAVVAKIEQREGAAASWVDRMLFVADNADAAGDFGASSLQLAAAAPPGSMVEQIDLASLGTTTARARLLAGIDVGVGTVNYVGHASYDALAAEKLLQSADVPLLKNDDRTFVLAGMTCTIGHFARPGSPSLGELLLRRPVAGAAAVWAPTGLSENELAVHLAEDYYKAVSADTSIRIGDAIASALASYRTTRLPDYIPAIYVLLGDPAMRLR